MGGVHQYKERFSLVVFTKIWDLSDWWCSHQNKEHLRLVVFNCSQNKGRLKLMVFTKMT